MKSDKWIQIGMGAMAGMYYRAFYEPLPFLLPAELMSEAVTAYAAGGFMSKFLQGEKFHSKSTLKNALWFTAGMAISNIDRIVMAGNALGQYLMK